MLAGLATLALSGTALAQNPAAASYPNRPVTVVTAFAVGSGPDAVLRIVGEKLGQRWKQSVTVDNRPGGGGFVAIEYARRAKPDGYTLLQLDSEHVSALPYLYKNKNFNTLDHFDPVAPLFLTPFFVAVPTSSPWKNMADLIRAAKAEPGKISYGSWGVGSPGHLGGEWLDYLSGSKMTHVPYREVSQLFTSVANGDPSWSFGSLPSSQGIYKSGKIRYIAVAAPKRIPQMPDVPTVAEAGGPAELDVNSFVSLLSPKGLDTATRDKIRSDVVAVLQDPQVREKFSTFAFQPITWSVPEMQQFAKKKSEQYKLLIEKAHISLD
ncbi:tripartite tricarboxylate transporter substrate binding protein [Comamonas testosteroni]|uniref:Tripartite tricarboxylate transporter substrate binding protein n=1 Tax=Comamonas testosteroni TaxID=285 RepID=A0A373FTS4_COMTE|nr:tripartite tricarboxylate transporter substrate binding protein [Comamonas testosteroni]RGE46845.1 tripartite tricarboxylate transporter substrate binding protein [Comamonas testosteroni]